MKKIKLILFSAIISSFFFTSCTELNSDELAGSDITTGGKGPTIVGWAQATVSESYFSDIGTLNNNYPVDVYGTSDGSPTTADITLTISVDAATTANGGEYSLPTTSVTIPAGTSFAGVPVDVNTGSFNLTKPTVLVLNVSTSVNGVVVSEALKQMKITFVGCKSTLAASTYDVKITRRNTGAVVTRTGISLTTLGVNYFETPYVGTWPLSPGVQFTDICGDLFMESHDLAAQYGNQITGAAGANGLAGTVDSNGNFTLTYNISLGTWGIYDAVYTKN
jgi:predicted small secreted protein